MPANSNSNITEDEEQLHRTENLQISSCRRILTRRGIRGRNYFRTTSTTNSFSNSGSSQFTDFTQTNRCNNSRNGSNGISSRFIWKRSSGRGWIKSEMNLQNQSESEFTSNTAFSGFSEGAQKTNSLPDVNSRKIPFQNPTRRNTFRSLRYLSTDFNERSGNYNLPTETNVNSEISNCNSQNDSRPRDAEPNEHNVNTTFQEVRQESNSCSAESSQSDGDQKQNQLRNDPTKSVFSDLEFSQIMNFSQSCRENKSRTGSNFYSCRFIRKRSNRLGWIKSQINFQSPPESPESESNCSNVSPEFSEDAQKSNPFPVVHLRGNRIPYRNSFQNSSTRNILRNPRYNKSVNFNVCANSPTENNFNSRTFSVNSQNNLLSPPEEEFNPHNTLSSFPEDSREHNLSSVENLQFIREESTDPLENVAIKNAFSDPGHNQLTNVKQLNNNNNSRTENVAIKNAFSDPGSNQLTNVKQLNNNNNSRTGNNLNSKRYIWKKSKRIIWMKSEATLETPSELESSRNDASPTVVEVAQDSTHSVVVVSQSNTIPGRTSFAFRNPKCSQPANLNNLNVDDNSRTEGNLNSRRFHGNSQIVVHAPSEITSNNMFSRISGTAQENNRVTMTALQASTVPDTNPDQNSTTRYAYSNSNYSQPVNVNQTNTDNNVRLENNLNSREFRGNSQIIGQVPPESNSYMFSRLSGPAEENNFTPMTASQANLMPDTNLHQNPTTRYAYSNSNYSQPVNVNQLNTDNNTPTENNLNSREFHGNFQIVEHAPSEFNNYNMFSRFSGAAEENNRVPMTTSQANTTPDRNFFQNPPTRFTYSNSNYSQLVNVNQLNIDNNAGTESSFNAMVFLGNSHFNLQITAESESNSNNMIPSLSGVTQENNSAPATALNMPPDRNAFQNPPTSYPYTNSYYTQPVNVNQLNTDNIARTGSYLNSRVFPRNSRINVQTTAESESNSNNMIPSLSEVTQENNSAPATALHMLSGRNTFQNLPTSYTYSNFNHSQPINVNGPNIENNARTGNYLNSGVFLRNSLINVQTMSGSESNSNYRLFRFSGTAQENNIASTTALEMVPNTNPFQNPSTATSHYPYSSWHYTRPQNGISYTNSTSGLGRRNSPNHFVLPGFLRNDGLGGTDSNGVHSHQGVSATGQEQSVSNPTKNNKLECPVCMRSTTEIEEENGNVVALECGHLFCSSCVQLTCALCGSEIKCQNKFHIMKCPICRLKTKGKEIRKIYI